MAHSKTDAFKDGTHVDMWWRMMRQVEISWKSLQVAGAARKDYLGTTFIHAIDIFTVKALKV